MKLAISLLVTLVVSGHILAQDPDLILEVTDAEALPGQGFVAMVMFDNLGTSVVDGWSIGVCIGDSSIVEAVAACGGLTSPPLTAPSADDPPCLDLNGGMGSNAIPQSVNGGGQPGWAGNQVIPGGGWMSHVVIDLFGVNKLPPGTGYLMCELIGTVLAEGTTTLTPCGTLDSPPVATVIIISGNSIFPTTIPGEISSTQLIPFIRGNCSSNTSPFPVDIADAVFLIGYLFPAPSGGNVLACADACDANDDGGINIADAVTMLGSLFGNPTTPLPLPNVASGCGIDPTVGPSHEPPVMNPAGQSWPAGIDCEVSPDC